MSLTLPLWACGGLVAAAVLSGSGGPSRATETREAAFAGGCFWCLQAAFEKVHGVIEVISGYAGGTVPDPTYEEVCAGDTGHLEAIRILYDPGRVSYGELLETFWRVIDPTDPGGQLVDRGSKYRTAVFYHDEEQKRLAEASRDALAGSGRYEGPLVTEILPVSDFYPAEPHHQGYHRKNPVRYRAYRSLSGRDRFLRRTWGDREPGRSAVKAAGGSSGTDAEKELTPLQFHVIRENGTEPPFRNEYWDNHREGIYVDRLSGEPLFRSTDKFDSGSGWPSFTRPLETADIEEREDRGHGMIRIEVRSRSSDAHLGHVFPDGPPPTGLRYCINSAALRFVPRERMEAEGYGAYLDLFEPSPPGGKKKGP